MEVSASKLSISAVGDVSLGDHPVCAGIGMRSAFRKRGGSILASVAYKFRESDLTIANLETVTSNKGLRPFWLPSYEMRGDPKSLTYLREAGIDLVGVANNHAMQHGEAAFHDMVERARGAGMEVIGTEETKGRTKVFEIVHEDGLVSGIVSLSIRPEEWAESSNSLPYSYRDSAEELLNEIARLRKEFSGFLICSLHWGLEFLDYPSPEQVELGHKLIDTGVDVLLGHHSHVLQPVEQYGQGLIFYSLGNFVFDLWPEETRYTAIAHVDLEKGKVPQFQITPVKIDPDYSLSIAIGSDARTVEELLSWERFQAMGSKPESESEYRGQYNNARRKFRFSSYRYFLKNCYRYPPWFFAQALGRTAIRRLTGT